MADLVDPRARAGGSHGSPPSDAVDRSLEKAKQPSVTVLGETPSAGPQTFAQLFRPHAGHMAYGFFWLAASNALALTVPSLVNAGIAVAEGNAKHGLSIVSVLLALAGCAVAGAITRVASRVVLFNVGRDVERALRAETFAHLSTLSPTYFRKNSTGDLMSRLTNDMTQIRLMAGFALLNALNTAILFAATLPILFSINAHVALWTLLPFPLVIALAQLTTRAMFKRTRAQQDALGKLSQQVQENLAGQQVVRAFSLEGAEQQRFDVAADNLYQAAMRLTNVRLFMGPLIGLFGSLGVVIALWVGGDEIAKGNLTVADLVELNTRILMLMWPTIALGFIISVIQRGRASLARINDILTIRPDVVDGAYKQALQGKITARGLRVEVKDGAPPALRDFDLQLAAGNVLGVVGKNASGKSTLLRAIARQLPIARGQLFVDDVDINDWHLTALRGRDAVGVVPEDGFLFSATLRDNLVFGRDDATEDEVQRVIDLCDLRRDVLALDNGLQTVVGERGLTLSGGQRQRVALARAILARPRILLLDDCLSAVDAETETHIVAALRGGLSMAADKKGHGTTVVVVSHRLSATQGADEIVVLDNTPEGGRVVERGAHGELINNHGLYADLWGREQLTKALAQ